VNLSDNFYKGNVGEWMGILQAAPMNNRTSVAEEPGRRLNDNN